MPEEPTPSTSPISYGYGLMFRLDPSMRHRYVRLVSFDTKPVPDTDIEICGFLCHVDFIDEDGCLYATLSRAGDNLRDDETSLLP